MAYRQLTSAAVAQSAPADVIREIFKYFACPFRIRFNGSFIDFPWYLGHICSAWRTVFLSMCTEFWGTFCLWIDYNDSDSGFPRACGNIGVMAKTFLKYNKGRLFSFDAGIHAPTAVEVVRAFVPESKRWLDAAISLRQSHTPILSPVKNHTPHLRSLELTTYYEHDSPASCERDIFENSPDLTVVKLKESKKWQLNWSSLAALVLTRSFASRFLEILPKLHNLEKLVIPALLETSNSNHDYTNMTIVKIPRLRVLRTRALMVLSVLQAPSLEELFINDTTLPAGLELECTSFLDRSGCSLQHLYMGQFDRSTVLSVLKRSPDIKSLAICGAGDGYHEYRYHYELLTCRSDMPSFAPRLQAFQMAFPHDPTNDIEAFTAMLASRTTKRLPSVERLQRITYASSPGDVSKLSIIEELCNEHGVCFDCIDGFSWLIKDENITWDLDEDIWQR